MHKVNRLKYLRLKNEITVSKLSKDTGISQTMISIYEHARNRCGIPFKRAHLLAEYFKITIYELIGLNQTIEISDLEFEDLFPKINEEKESPMINLFLTQPRRSLKDTVDYLKSRSSRQY